MIIFVKNISLEGPETLGTFFQKQGYPSMEIDLQAGDSLPRDLNGVQALVVLGGPMNVYEEDKYPFLKEEDTLIRRAVAQGVPYLGICLGAQLLAKACGARVGRSPQQEIGFSPIRLTKDGLRDPLLDGLPEEIEIFQWHGDMFGIPDGARWLASSSGCPHQAMRVGHNAYGVQFHFEVTGRNIREWADAYFDVNNAAQKAAKEKMMDDYREKKDQFHRVADKICMNFLDIILTSQSHQVTKSPEKAG